MISLQEWQTADLIDMAPDSPTCETQFSQFGLRKAFHGKIRTIRCFQDNGLVKSILNSDGDAQVLVIDGGGSLYSALVGDMIAQSACNNNWAGIIVYGVVRDSVALQKLPIGIKALGSNPKKSAKNSSGEVDCAVHFGKVTFHAGDYVYSDEDGIIVVSKPIHHEE